MKTTYRRIIAVLRSILDAIIIGLNLLLNFFREVEVERIVINTYKDLPVTVAVALVMTWIFTNPFTWLYALYAVVTGLLFALLYELVIDFHKYLVIYEGDLARRERELRRGYIYAHEEDEEDWIGYTARYNNLVDKYPNNIFLVKTLMDIDNTLSIGIKVWSVNAPMFYTILGGAR